MMAMKSINAEEKDDDRKKCEDDNEGKARQYHGEERNGMRGTIIIIILHLHTLTLSIYFGRKHVQRKLKLNEK
uniref:Transmembrane protein n=1 Tax=Tetranychus urticae TaxID=32264 RepID=T1JRF0_TETUR